MEYINNFGKITFKDVLTDEMYFEGTSFIAIDTAKPDSKDFSALCTSCGNCKAIIQVETFTDEYPTEKLPKECPECGMKFTKRIIMK